MYILVIDITFYIISIDWYIEIRKYTILFFFKLLKQL